MNKDMIFRQMKRDEYPKRDGTGCAIIGTIVILAFILVLLYLLSLNEGPRA